MIGAPYFEEMKASPCPRPPCGQTHLPKQSPLDFCINGITNERRTLVLLFWLGTCPAQTAVTVKVMGDRSGGSWTLKISLRVTRVIGAVFARMPHSGH